MFKFLETTKPEPDLKEMVITSLTSILTYPAGHNVWQPIIAKVDEKYAQEVGLQMQKQIKHFTGVQAQPQYKFECVADVFLLEGCWLADVIYTDSDYIVLTIRFDNATQFKGVDYILK